MSATRPLGSSREGTVPLSGTTLGAQHALRHGSPGQALRGSRRLTRRRLAVVGLGLSVLTTLLVCLAAAHTDALLPESVRPVPGWLAGPFGSASLHLGSAILILLFGLMFLGYVLAVRGADQIGPGQVLMAVAALHALVLLAPPLLSTDLFSYQAYARIWGMYHANPYLQGPHALALDPLYPFVGAKWVNTPSAYGPLFTALSLPTAHLSIAAGALAFKVLAAVASLSTAVLVWHAAKLRGLNPARAVALVALNPLVVLWGVGGGHNDLLMLALLTAGVYCLLAHRARAAGALPVLAGVVKLTGALFLPFMLAGERGLGASGRRRRLVLGAGAAAAAASLLGFGLFGTGQLRLLQTLQQTQSQGDWHSIPGFISTRLGLGTIGHIAGLCLGVLFLAIFVWLLRRVWRGEMDWIDGAGWTAVALLVTAGSMLPWYVAWLMPFAALGSDRGLWRVSLIVTGLVVAIQMIGFLPHTSSLPGL